MAGRKSTRTAGPYSEKFFASHNEGSYRSALAVLPIVFAVFRPGSIVDVGCGTGAWLRAAAELGVADYHGYDGTQSKRLAIPPERFTLADLSRPLGAARRFDLAICSEVAEHLPPDSAGTLVASVTALSDVVLFSAAIPGQGGTHHVNEQWPDYWQALFQAKGFSAYDVLRPKIWNDTGVQWWYRQNLVVYVADVAAARYSLAPKTAQLPALVHPELWEARLRKQVVKNLVRSAKRAITRVTNR